jgi:hypothetical protein
VPIIFDAGFVDGDWELFERKQKLSSNQRQTGEKY